MTRLNFFAIIGIGRARSHAQIPGGGGAIGSKHNGGCRPEHSTLGLGETLENEKTDTLKEHRE